MVVIYLAPVGMIAVTSTHVFVVEAFELDIFEMVFPSELR